MTETIKRAAVYMCCRGVPQSAARLMREPTAAEWAELAELGFERATEGRHYRRNVVCPVNGDGYWHTRCELLDADGMVVGSAEVSRRIVSSRAAPGEEKFDSAARGIGGVAWRRRLHVVSDHWPVWAEFRANE